MSVQEKITWKFVGGHLSLDFVNSVGGRAHRNKKNIYEYEVINDKLKSYFHFIDWAQTIGIIDSSATKTFLNNYKKNKKPAEKLLVRSIKLREAFYRILLGVINNIEPLKEDLELLNNECDSAEKKRKLFYGKEEFYWDFDIEDFENDIIINTIALSAAELLTTGNLQRLKECSGEDCGWIFLDTSKNKSRQWCDMKDCGNLAKVRRFRKKN